MIAGGHDRERSMVVAGDRAVCCLNRDLKPDVNVEEEFESMSADAAENILDEPIALALIKRNDATMGDR